MQTKTKFYSPKPVRMTYGSIFDHKGDLVDIDARGLAGHCEGKGVHNWLLIPHQEGHKEYVFCMGCFNLTHL